jgi:mutator protein MutT
MECGETPQACVQRELKEEVALEIHPVEALDVIDYAYPTVHVRLHPFVCEWRGGEATALACQEVRWVSAIALKDYSFPPANKTLLQQVMAKMEGERYG